MTELITTLILGLGFVILSITILYWFWMRPAVERAREIAEKEAELVTGKAILQAKEEAIRLREKLEEEAKEKQASLARQEDRLCAREESLEKRREQLENRDRETQQEQLRIEEASERIKSLELQAVSELQRISGLSLDEAKDLLLEKTTQEFADSAAKRAKQLELELLAEVDKKAKKTLLEVMQRSVVDYVTEATLAVVELPSEDMKGRIIGREGRNIRAFEQVTGVDLIVDETPEAVVISCFDPVRRETARLALMNLMVDGRIHPGRIEELYEKAQQEVDRMIKDAGERAVDRANVPGIHPNAIEVLGRLRFRTSFAQNVLDHSVEVSRLSGHLAAELGLNVEIAKRAGLLHDIGKALGPEWEGPHAITGMEYLRTLGEKENVLNPVGAHHFEIQPETPEAMLVIIADSISASRPGARRESLENYIKRLASLEQIANSFTGVDRSYALQAGREVRVIVKPDEIDDLSSMRLANDIAKRIEAEMEYPGHIKVTVIRETRASDFAK